MGVITAALNHRDDKIARLEKRVAGMREALSRISTHALCVDGIERKLSDIARTALEKDDATCN